jgi:hypothetical protein
MLPNSLCLTPGGDLGAQRLRSVVTDDSRAFRGLPVCFAPVFLFDTPSSGLRPSHDVVKHLPQRFLDLPARAITPPSISWFARAAHVKDEP